MVNQIQEAVSTVFCIDTIADATAGTENQLVLLTRHLSRAGVKVTIALLHRSPWVSRNIDYCPVYELGVKSLFSLLGWTKVAQFSKFLRENKVQVVHTFFHDASIVGIFAARLANVPVVISSRRNRGYWHTPKEIFITKRANRWVTRILANSEDVKQSTHEVEGYPLEKIDVIYNGMDLNRFTCASIEGRNRIRCDYEISPDGTVAVMVANLRPVKAHEVIIKAMPRVLSECPNLVLLLVGEGQERARIEEQIKKAGIGQNVLLLGTRTDIQDILRAADLGVLSSRSESLSNSIMEYMASGLPVVATDIGGTREMITHEENGLLVPPGNPESFAEAVITLLKNSDLRLKMGAANRIKAQKMFSVERMVREHEELYIRLLKEAGRL